MQTRNDANQIPHDTINLLLFAFAHQKTQHSFVDSLESRRVETDHVGCHYYAQEG